MKPPLSYYGGKQRLVSTLLPLIPKDHDLYAEPFSGGAALFYAKSPSEIEVLNDTNKELMNFYQVVKTNFAELEQLVRITLHSRQAHQDATVIINHPHLFSIVRRAWAVWVLCLQSFSSQLNGPWGFDKTKKSTTTKKISNKREQFTEEYAARLQNVQLENSDAIYIITSRDSERAFFYVDPPYFNSDCGHYKGYTEADFIKLLDTLSQIKGRFLLSSYPSEVLTKYTRKFKWQHKSVEQLVSVNKNSGKKKTEVMTWNYSL